MRDKKRNKEYQKKWYINNRELHITRNKANMQKKLDWFNNYKITLKCAKCEQNHPATLDFHHRDPKKKDRQIIIMVRRNCGMKRILEEIAKCDVLCANCHRILHWEEKHKN